LTNFHFKHRKSTTNAATAATSVRARKAGWTVVHDRAAPETSKRVRASLMLETIVRSGGALVYVFTRSAVVEKKSAFRTCASSTVVLCETVAIARPFAGVTVTLIREKLVRTLTRNDFFSEIVQRWILEKSLFFAF
jgi:hypothetical protein